MKFRYSFELLKIMVKTDRQTYGIYFGMNSERPFK